MNGYVFFVSDILYCIPEISKKVIFGISFPVPVEHKIPKITFFLIFGAQHSIPKKWF